MPANASTKKLRIMLVDAHFLHRTRAKKVLKDIGFTDVVEATDGQQALKVLDISKPNFVITDLDMPNMSGMELVRKIRETDSSIPIIMLTNSAEKSKVLEAISAGTSDYLLKPVNPEILAAKIEKLTG